MTSQPWIIHRFDRLILAKESRDFQSVLRVAAHPIRKRPDAAANQPAIGRRRPRAASDLNLAHFIEETILIARDDQSACRIAMSAEVLGASVHNQIGAKLERTLQHR